MRWDFDFDMFNKYLLINGKNYTWVPKIIAKLSSKHFNQQQQEKETKSPFKKAWFTYAWKNSYH